MIEFHLITLFPEMFISLQELGVTGRAYQKGLWQSYPHNPRDVVHNVHKTVDDRPYGGGPGMLMMFQPLSDTIEAMQQSLGAKPFVVYLSPQGKPLTQARVQALSELSHVALLCGRYEGIDERFIEHYVDEEISLGDFVVSGGELPAMMLMDAVIRLLPGALGHDASAAEDSFTDGLLDCPHYTRPPEVMGMKVPDVLQSGNHAHIKRWRLKQQLLRTRLRRPDLLQQRTLSQLEKQLMLEIDQEMENGLDLSSR